MQVPPLGDACFDDMMLGGRSGVFFFCWVGKRLCIYPASF
jgi:hypothetical protein